MMQETQRRPGGLTALAVLNLIFAAGSLMGLLFLAVAVVVFQTMDGQGIEEARQDFDAAIGQASLPALIAHIALSFVATALQAISAFGYLRMAPRLGRGVGNAFAIVSLLDVVLSAVLGLPFTMGSIINLLYPLLTLLLLNVTFRADFVRSSAQQRGTAQDSAPADALDADLAAAAAQRRMLVARFGGRHTLRGGSGVLYLLTLLGGGLMIAATFITPLEGILEDKSPRAAARAQEFLSGGMAVDAISWITGADEKSSAYFVKDQPSLQSAILLFLLAFMPFFACMGGFNQTAGEIGSKGLRFLLLRTDRRSLFFGRFLGTLWFSTIGLIVLVAVITLYILFKLDLYSAGAVLAWGAQGLLALWLIMLPHLAAAAWLSASLNSALAAFSLSMAVVSAPILVVKMLQFALLKLADHDALWLDRLMPWGWKFELLSPDLPLRLLASVMMIVFTVVLLAAGLRRFETRDL